MWVTTPIHNTISFKETLLWLRPVYRLGKQSNGFARARCMRAQTLPGHCLFIIEELPSTLLNPSSYEVNLQSVLCNAFYQSLFGRMVSILLLRLITVHALIPILLAGNVISKNPIDCVNGPGVGQRWACLDPALSFPTVAYLTRDMLTCGRVTQDKSCVFYSVGAKGDAPVDAFAANELGGKGISFKGAMGDDYIKQVANHPRWGDLREQGYYAKRLVNSGNLNRREIWNRKLAQAFASVCSDEAYLLVQRYRGAGGGVGIYQIPKDRDNTPPWDVKDNVWVKDEFPALTMNNKINKIFSVDTSNNNKISLDWVKRAGQRMPRNIDAMQLPPTQWAPGTYPQQGGPPPAGQAQPFAGQAPPQR